MYKIKITANTKSKNLNKLSTKAKYSPKDVYDFLLSVNELKGEKITAAEYDNESCKFTIGDTTYLIMHTMI